MRNWRTMVGALCIVLAMVLGAFAGFVYARPGGVGAPSETGTRGEDRRVIALSELENGPMSLEEAQAADANGISFAAEASTRMTTPDGNVVTTTPLTNEEMRENERLQSRTFESEHGTITVEGTRGAWPPGTVDAGGPYGGPNTFEGDPPITFTVTAYDPAIIFFRWDFNNDGKFDYPDQTGGGTLGRWTTETTIEKQYLDNYYGDIVVQGWDGVSTIVNIVSGDNLGGSTTINVSLGMFGGDYRWVGWRFTAKRDVTLTQLGYYRTTYMIYQLVIRDYPSANGVYLGMCDPVDLTLSWNWCTLPTPVSLIGGKEYWVAERIESSSVGQNNPADNSVVHFVAAVGMFCYSPNVYCWSPFQWSTSWIPKVDFRWSYTEILPDAAADTAFLEVHNVAPSVFNVMTTPSPILEGGPGYMTVQFSDPGLDDTWEYRWTFLDGTNSGWQPINKMAGGAKVLILHTFYSDVTALQASLRTSCGAYCTKLDQIDFGPTGQNRIPALSELTPYDVLLVGTNYGPLPSSSGMGDRLAEYMDAGGNVVMAQFGFDNRDTFGIGGRWQDEAYAPVTRGATLYTSSSLGTIYVPGHPILDGVASLTASYLGPNYGVTTGATRVADFAIGTVAIATKEMPNGARAVALPWFPIANYGAGGDYLQIIVNSFRWASQQPEPTVKPMPITTDPYMKVFVDDDPTTTTPQDTFGVHVDVRDDDDGQVELHDETELFFQDFQNPAQCSYSSTVRNWPPGWSAVPLTGWRCQQDSYLASRGPVIYYYYNDGADSNLYTNTFDLSGYVGVRFEYRTFWAGDYAAGTSDGYIEGTTDGGATWASVKEYHHMNPPRFNGNDKATSAAVGFASNVQFRFRYTSGNDWWWLLDNIRIFGLEGAVIDGLGGVDGSVTVANVPPTVVGGFDSALRDESQGLLFQGFQISDPALITPTEWFAYRMDFGDGTPASWVYTGSLAPPKLKVYVVHTLCPSGNACIYYTDLRNALLKQDDVASVAGFNYFSALAAPTLSTMMQYDVIIIAMNYAYYSYAPFDLARRMIGDRLADYLDSGRGGVVTMVGVHSLYSGYASWDLDGRYISDKYGAFQGRTTLSGAVTGLNILEPSHELFVKVGSDVNSLFVASGNMPLSVGGNTNAAGVNGQLLARWRSSGNTAIGVKELLNGARTAHIGFFGQPSGADTPMLLRNAVGWVAGGLPSPNVPAVTHTYGDNGIYTVDFTLIDDDMGYAWDPVQNMPVVALPGQESVSHRYVSVAVNNVDPAIQGGIEAFIATEVCVRVSGTSGNTVSVDLYTDGAWTTRVSTTRMNGDPNPPTEKCGMLRIDVTALHSYAATLTYADPNGGSNPTWLIFEPWREPVTPGHGTVSYKYDFDAAGSMNLALPSLKQDLLSGGQGAKIDFAAEAYDPGTDDLAFLWTWGTVDGIPYEVPNPTDAVYTIHVHHNAGVGRTDGTLAGPQYLGYSESFFDRPANTGRSPMGTMDFRVRDTAVHAFDLQQPTYYVMLLVLDDDNTRGYPSAFAPNDGVDMQFVVLYLG